MTAKEHGRLLGIFFLIQAGLQLFGGLVAIVIYGGMGAMLLTNSRKEEDQFVGMIFVVLSFVMVFFVAILALLEGIVGWRFLKNKPHSKVLPTIMSILSLLGFPLGTVLGVYGLWFIFGDNGKEYYDGNVRNMSNAIPPPPPNSWQQ